MKFLGPSLVALGASASLVTAFVTTPMAVQPRTIQPKPFDQTVLSMSDETGVTDLGNDDFELLGRPARPGRPLKVAIAGGGVGGLTTALCMLKKGFDVTVYERTQEFARFGGPIQVSCCCSPHFSRERPKILANTLFLVCIECSLRSERD